MALAGVIAGYVGMVLWVLAVLLIPALSRVRSGPGAPSCQTNLKHHGLVCKIYASENRMGYFPPMSREPGRLMYAMEDSEDQPSVYPEFLTDLGILFCPSDTDVASGDPAVDLDDHSYFYLNYAIDSDESAEALADAYVAAMEAGESLPDMIPVTLGQGAAGLDTIPRIREGIERFLITDINNPASGAMLQSVIPVMIERLGNHVPEGGNVLFMDGHVEFIRYPGKFPMTERTVAALERMDQAKSPESR
jgi:prepilin-type processing-associated H-X9-DG protein